MKVLVIGGGGREHALCWKLRQGARVGEVLCAPGNAGIAEVAERVAVAADDVPALVRLARDRRVDLTVVGPEAPLALGIVDELERAGLAVFGPDREGSRLEASKAFAKEILEAEGVATARARTFTELAAAREHVETAGAPIVVKADGLAAGKGVTVCATTAEALEAVEDALGRRVFGDAGRTVVVEEFLAGEEASFMALTDGETVLPLDSSQDHKRIHDGDLGPNTGGMGAYSPAPVVTPEIAGRVMDEVLLPVVAGLRKRGIRYRGVLYAGLMIEGGCAKVLEFNVRFGDPECQALLVRLKSDLAELARAVVERRLREVRLEWDERPSVSVVLAADGYPGAVRKGDAIEGLEAAGAERDVVVFHAGTERRDGKVVTAGGRVLGVTALGATVADAARSAYAAAEKIHWRGMQYRRDIGARAV